MKKLFMPLVLVLFLIFSQVVNAATPVQDPANGELNLYQVINQMNGTSFTSSQDPALEALQVGSVGKDDMWHEWNGHISIVATYAGYDQNLYWENSQGAELIHSAALDGVHFYEDNPITFQTYGGDFWFKDMTSGGTWYSCENMNTPNEVHMVTYSFGNGVFICAFEDMSGGDDDFNDLVFKIGYGTSPVTVPSVSYIPDQAVSGGYLFSTIELDNYVRDDDGAETVTWTTSGGVNISVSIDPATRIAATTYPSGWTGSETITFRATDDTDPLGFYDSEDVEFTVNPPDAPVVIDIPDQTIKNGRSFYPISLDDYVYHPAPEIDDEDIAWTTEGGENISVYINESRVAHVSYPSDWTGSETITFIATINPSGSNPATFTVLSAGSGGGGGSVGGVALPVDKFSLIAPWVGLIVVITTILGLVVMWKKKRSSTMLMKS